MKRRTPTKSLTDVLRLENNLAAWLEVRDDLLALGVSAQQFYRARALPRDRSETDEEVAIIAESYVPRWRRN